MIPVNTIRTWLETTCSCTTSRVNHYWYATHVKMYDHTSAQMALTLHLKGHSVIEIRRQLNEDNIVISRQALHKLIQKYRMGMLYQLSGPHQGKKITEEMKSVIDEMLRNNDEVTSIGLKCVLTARWPKLRVSIATIKRARKEMS